MADWLGGIGNVIGGIGAIGSAIAAWFGGEKQADSIRATNSANVDLSLRRMQWEERMANTVHQRAVKDLKAAGLNPMLSARYGGNPVPPAINTVLQAPYGNMAQHSVNSANAVANVANAIQQMLQNKALAKMMTAEADWLENNAGPAFSAKYFGTVMKSVRQAMSAGRKEAKTKAPVAKSAFIRWLDRRVGDFDKTIQHNQLMRRR